MSVNELVAQPFRFVILGGLGGTLNAASAFLWLDNAPIVGSFLFGGAFVPVAIITYHVTRCLHREHILAKLARVALISFAATFAGMAAPALFGTLITFDQAIVMLYASVLSIGIIIAALIVVRQA